MSETPTPAELIETLGTMTPDEIAGVIETLGIVGIRGVARECPLSRYVEKMTGHPISTGTIDWADRSGWINVVDEVGKRTPLEWRPLPESCVRFVQRVDDLEYPRISRPIGEGD